MSTAVAILLFVGNSLCVRTLVEAHPSPKEGKDDGRLPHQLDYSKKRLLRRAASV